MSMSHRARREWRIFLWVSLASAAVSAFFGVRVGPADESWLRLATHGAI
jgi:adenylate cyclase